MSARISLLAVAAILLIAATACTTPYRPRGSGGGYTDARLDRNVFRVIFDGSAGMGQAATDEMALLRAAEVSLQNGCPFFVSSGASATGQVLSVPGGVLSIPSSTLTITCYETRPETSFVVYDAARVVDTLSARYSRP